VDQIPFFVEESIVSGAGKPESLRSWAEKAGEFDRTAWIDGLVRSRLHHETRSS
jgi:hypothetical protein